MGLNCGIVGLPNVGKSTLFQAITNSQAEAANYPFCTIEPNMGIVQVPDSRLRQLEEIVHPQKTLPAIVEFVDIAGLVKGASKGEGLGNQFLGHIRSVGAIVHVVRCFENDDIVHVNGKVDPLDDIQTINYELALADLESVQKKHSNLDKLMKSQDKKISGAAKELKPVLEKLINTLEEGKAARECELDDYEVELVKDLQLITAKPIVYVCNVDEDTVAGEDNEHVKSVKEYAQKEGQGVIKICASIESEIANLESQEEKDEFLKEMGIEESGLSKLIKTGYDILGLQTYFTAGEKEVRAWTFKKGMSAPQCAGIIHTDFERGFIRAETYACEDLFSLGSVPKVKESGKLRLEGKDYIVQDGDVMLFRFNV